MSETYLLDPVACGDDGKRQYIPLPGGWEIQTKGSGSTFRLCHVHTKGDPDGYDRWPVLDTHLHAPLEQMANAAHASNVEMSGVIATQAAQIETLKLAFERAGRIINALQGYLGERALSSAVYSELQQHAEDRAALSNTGKK